MSTITKLRGSGNRSASAGVVTLIAQISLDPTLASAATGYVLPKGSVVIGVTSHGGSTGGISPTVDVGVDGTVDAIAGELPSDTAGAAPATYGASSFAMLTDNTEIWAGVGASAATGGTTVLTVKYYIYDVRDGANS